MSNDRQRGPAPGVRHHELDEPEAVPYRGQVGGVRHTPIST